ncbi:hypothetical protein FACS1894152_1250 [Bacilli bacterium]|nr:hypothetical protein FACS1894152_1250 [Bacilli bacterium]
MRGTNMKKYKLMQGIFGSILVLGGVTAIPITTSCSIKLNVTNFKGTVSAQYDVGSDDLSGTLSTDKYYVIGFTTTNDVKPSGNISLERSSGISKEGLQILTFNLINDKSDSFKPLKNLNGHIKNQGFSVQADERLTINV